MRYKQHASLVAATGALLTAVACNNPSGKAVKTDTTTTTTTTEASATPPAQGQPAPQPAVADKSIAYVNADSLAAKYSYFKQAKSKLEAKAKAAQNDLIAKGQAFQREVAQYQQQAASLPADQRKATEERLARKQQDLQGYQQSAGGRIAEEQAKEQEKLYDKVAAVLKDYANRKGYKVILQYQKGTGNILYISPTLDITNEVITELNRSNK